VERSLENIFICDILNFPAINELILNGLKGSYTTILVFAASE
jgi:hypothetical protein